MQVFGLCRLNPELRELVVEASLALARMDAERLEELALSCQALNRDPAPASAAEREEFARQARDAAGDMAILGRVLEATRANLDVMSRLWERRDGRLEYARCLARGSGAPRPWALAVKCDGND